jgi:protein gp37
MIRTIKQHNGEGKLWRVGKKAAGRLLDGREWNEMPNSELGTDPKHG